MRRRVVANFASFQLARMKTQRGNGRRLGFAGECLFFTVQTPKPIGNLLPSELTSLVLLPSRKTIRWNNLNSQGVDVTFPINTESVWSSSYCFWADNHFLESQSTWGNHTETLTNVTHFPVSACRFRVTTASARKAAKGQQQRDTREIWRYKCKTTSLFL